METTPNEIDDKVMRLCEQITGVSQIPTFVRVSPEAYCRPSECFENVKEKILRDGGNSIFGWAIWRYNNILIEGEAHAVWMSTEGEIIDITPQLNHEKRILFLEDKNFIYEGKQIDNIRMALTDSKLTHEYLRLHDAQFDLIGGFPPNFPITLTVQNGLNEFLKIKHRLRELDAIFNMEVGRNDLCPCGSGRKYKKCCLPFIAKGNRV